MTHSPETREKQRQAALHRYALVRGDAVIPPAPDKLTSTEYRHQNVGEAFDVILTGLSALATARGHVMGAPRRDDKLTAAMQCAKCERWVVFSIPAANATDDTVDLRGAALGYCPGTPHKPVSITDNGLRSMALADGTMA